MKPVYFTWFIYILAYAYAFPFIVQAQDSKRALEYFENEGGFSVIEKSHTGNLDITTDTRVIGTVVGNIYVHSQMRLVVNGQVVGDVTIAPEGRAIFNGQVVGSISLGKGSFCRLKGEHTGQLINNGGQFVGPGAAGTASNAASNGGSQAGEDVMVINKDFHGQLIVNKQTKVNGNVIGSIVVENGMDVVVVGQVTGPITVGDEARAMIYGQVIGDITLGARSYCKVKKQHTGQVVNNGGKFVGPKEKN
jgi:cytoskeletal protein CcmA (bactofilin family)